MELVITLFILLLDVATIFIDGTRTSTASRARPVVRFRYSRTASSASESSTSSSYFSTAITVKTKPINSMMYGSAREAFENVEMNYHRQVEQKCVNAEFAALRLLNQSLWTPNMFILPHNLQVLGYDNEVAHTDMSAPLTDIVVGTSVFLKFELVGPSRYSYGNWWSVWIRSSDSEYVLEKEVSTDKTSDIFVNTPYRDYEPNISSSSNNAHSNKSTRKSRSDNLGFFESTARVVDHWNGNYTVFVHLPMSGNFELDLVLDTMSCDGFPDYLSNKKQGVLTRFKGWLSMQAQISVIAAITSATAVYSSSSSVMSPRTSFSETGATNESYAVGNGCGNRSKCRSSNIGVGISTADYGGAAEVIQYLCDIGYYINKKWIPPKSGAIVLPIRARRAQQQHNSSIGTGYSTTASTSAAVAFSDSSSNNNHDRSSSSSRMSSGSGSKLSSSDSSKSGSHMYNHRNNQQRVLGVDEEPGTPTKRSQLLKPIGKSLKTVAAAHVSTAVLTAANQKGYYSRIQAHLLFLGDSTNCQIQRCLLLVREPCSGEEQCRTTEMHRQQCVDAVNVSTHRARWQRSIADYAQLPEPFIAIMGFHPMDRAITNQVYLKQHPGIDFSAGQKLHVVINFGLHLMTLDWVQQKLFLRNALTTMCFGSHYTPTSSPTSSSAAAATSSSQPEQQLQQQQQYVFLWRSSWAVHEYSYFPNPYWSVHSAASKFAKESRHSNEQIAALRDSTSWLHHSFIVDFLYRNNCSGVSKSVNITGTSASRSSNSVVGGDVEYQNHYWLSKAHRKIASDHDIRHLDMQVVAASVDLLLGSIP